MAVPFVPPIGPSPGTGIETEVRLIKSGFGDGYGQSSPAGLNHIRKRVSLTWTALTLEQALEIENFFIARKGCEPFTYRLRGEATDRKWVCESWSRTDNAPHSFRCEIVESFSLN